jgi:hypothetical protein
VPDAVFAGPLPGLVVVLPSSCGEHMFMTTCDLGHHTPFPGVYIVKIAEFQGPVR